MPHISLEYSANLEGALDIRGLCEVLRDAAQGTGLFPLAGTRLRAFAATHVVIADGDPQHGFIDIHLRIGAGRSDAQKVAAADAIFDAACAYTAAYMSKRPFLLSLDLTEADAALSRKTSSIRDHLPPHMH